MFLNRYNSEPIATNLDDRLPYPHYSDDRFSYGKGEKLIFDDGQKGRWTNYSDRFLMWDGEACERANKAVKNLPNSTKQVTGTYFKTWLEGYHGSTVQLHKIWACTDNGGYPIWCFNYDIEESNEK